MNCFLVDMSVNTYTTDGNKLNPQNEEQTIAAHVYTSIGNDGELMVVHFVCHQE